MLTSELNRSILHSGRVQRDVENMSKVGSSIRISGPVAVERLERCSMGREISGYRWLNIPVERDSRGKDGWASKGMTSRWERSELGRVRSMVMNVGCQQKLDRAMPGWRLAIRRRASSASADEMCGSRARS